MLALLRGLPGCIQMHVVRRRVDDAVQVGIIEQRFIGFRRVAVELFGKGRPLVLRSRETVGDFQIVGTLRRGGQYI